MYWSELQQLIRNAQQPWANIRYFRDPKVNPTSMAVFDRSLPRRNPDDTAETGYSEEDHWRDSHVTEGAYFNGEIPLFSSWGAHDRGETRDEIKSEFGDKVFRGAFGVLDRLLIEGSLRETDDIRRLYHLHKRRIPTPPPPMAKSKRDYSGLRAGGSTS